MVLERLELTNFRAHENTNAVFGPGLNIISGPNGAGKTNLLEAIHFLALSKSFLTSRDRYALTRGKPHFELKGTFTERGRVDQKVRLAFLPGEGKKAFVNGTLLTSLAELVGKIPVVLFAPSDQALTADGPDERRGFLNNVLSQSRPRYLRNVLHFRRVLKQRNALLTKHRRQHIPDEILGPWTNELVRSGADIIAERNRFVTLFNGFLETAFTRIAGVGERPTITYQSLPGFNANKENTTEQIEGVYRENLQRLASREREMGRTMCGPHRDDLIFRLNNYEVRRYASHGQHRTFGMALKLAKYFYLHDVLDVQPILMLDDIFGDLDSHRTKVFLDLLTSDDVGQTLLTTVDPQMFKTSGATSSSKAVYISVSSGGIIVGEPQGPAAQETKTDPFTTDNDIQQKNPENES